MSSLFSDFLTALGVKHTENYSDTRFEDMPFQSMFGIANLLKEYNVGTIGVKANADAKADAIAQFPVPFLADTNTGFTIVQKIESGNVTYMTQHKTFTMPLSDFVTGWNGIALLAATDSTSIEPEYTRHHIAELSTSVKHVIVQVLAAALIVFALWRTGQCSHWYAWVLVALDCVGIALSWMLVQKSLGIHNETAEAVCSALEEGGCDLIAQSEASSFMGIFKWSEVGMAYFSISLVATLLFPRALPVLAAINVLCLPYTVWSITYQRFVAKAWCTLCVCVQTTLWLLFLTYLIGGAIHHILPLTTHFIVDFIALGCCYVAVLLGLNWLDDYLLKSLKKKNQL